MATAVALAVVLALLAVPSSAVRAGWLIASTSAGAPGIVLLTDDAGATLLTDDADTELLTPQ